MNNNLLDNKSGGFRFRLYPEDVLGIFFFCLLLLLSLKFGTEIKKPTVVVKAVINVILIIAGLSIISGKFGFTLFKVIRNWVPIVIVLFAYENLGNLVRFINPHDADPVIKSIDQFIFFGTNPNLYLERFINPWLSELMHFFYTSYYPFLPILGFFLYMGRDYHKFRNVMVGVTLGFYIGYIGYLLVPVVGPRFYMAGDFTMTIKGTTMLSDSIYDMINRLESTRRDCFPSLHTAITVIVTTFAFKYKRFLFWCLLPVNIGIIAATIYLRYHYVTDVIAGLMLAAFCVWAAPHVNNFWYRHVTGDHVLEDYPDRLDIAEKAGRFLKKIVQKKV